MFGTHESQTIDPEEPSVIVIERRCDEKGMRVTGFDRILISVIIGIVFFLMATPLMFKLSNKATRMVGVKTVNDSGVTTTTGLILHTIIFIIIVRCLMY